MNSFIYHALKSGLTHKLAISRTKEELKQQHKIKFSNLIKHIYKHSLYYKNLIDKIGKPLNELTVKDFPVMDKTVLMNNFDDIITDKSLSKSRIKEFLKYSDNPEELLDDKYVIINSSGSSGQVGYFVYSIPEFTSGLTHIINFNTPHLRQKIAYIASIKGHFAGCTIASATKRLKLSYKDTLMIDINEPYQKIIKKLNQFQPDILSGYPTVLRKLAKSQLSGQLDISVNTINCGGEALLDHTRDLLEEVFNAPVINVYACSEHLSLGVSKKEYKGMYLLEEDLIFELNTDNVYITNLFNYTLPLIRYKMSDSLKETKSKIYLYNLRKIENFVGRNENTIYFTNTHGEKDFIHPLILAGLTYHGLKSYQFHINKNDEITLHIVLDAGLSESEKKSVEKYLTKTMLDILHEKEMPHIKFSVKEVSNLWVDKKTGKFKLIERES